MNNYACLQVRHMEMIRFLCSAGKKSVYGSGEQNCETLICAKMSGSGDKETQGNHLVLFRCPRESCISDER
jgi:hypothetical protein